MTLALPLLPWLPALLAAAAVLGLLILLAGLQRVFAQAPRLASARGRIGSCLAARFANRGGARLQRSGQYRRLPHQPPLQ